MTDSMKANIRSANAATTKHATPKLPQHDDTQNILAVASQGDGRYVLDPQKLVASVLPSVQNPEDRPVEVRSEGLLDSLTSRPHEDASTQPRHIDCSVGQVKKS